MALVAAMKEMYVCGVVRYNLTTTADGRSESLNSSPMVLKRGPLSEPLLMDTLPGSRGCWTAPRELSFLVGRQTRQRDILLLRSFAELRLTIRL